MFPSKPPNIVFSGACFPHVFLYGVIINGDTQNGLYFLGENPTKPWLSPNPDYDVAYMATPPHPTQRYEKF